MTTQQALQRAREVIRRQHKALSTEESYLLWLRRGLRVSEPLNLRIKDIDLDRQRLCIRGAKGGNDRVVRLPSPLVPEIIQQVRVARVIWHQDRQDDTPLMLPNRLAKKVPSHPGRNRKALRASRKSSGGSASNFSRFPLRGWMKANSRA